MTQTESQALADRLTRVWGVGCSKETGSEWILNRVYFQFETPVVPNMKFRYSQECFKVHPVFVLERFDGERKTGSLQCDPSVFSVLPQLEVITGYAVKKNEVKEEFEQFVIEGTPFFRRSCWLSGCPIEASAHERMEWIQSAEASGITRQELNSWNLHF